jgi:putative transposase
MCSAYIDLNPVRANMVQVPEEYRWSSLGLQVRNPKRAKRLLTLLSVSHMDDWSSPASEIMEKLQFVKPDSLAWYRGFVYCLGGIECEGKATISKEILDQVISYHGRLGLGNRFRYRVRNISEGVAMGNFDFIAGIQEKFQRKFIRPRSFLSGSILYSTRVLRE